MNLNVSEAGMIERLCEHPNNLSDSICLSSIEGQVIAHSRNEVQIELFQIRLIHSKE